MTFQFGQNKIIISRYDNGVFQEETLTLSGAGGVSVSEFAGGFVISGTESSGNTGGISSIGVSSFGSPVYSGASLNFLNGFTVGSGSQASIIINELDFTTVVKTVSGQTISGIKTFVSSIVAPGIGTAGNTDFTLTRSGSNFIELTSSGLILETPSAVNITFKTNNLNRFAISGVGGDLISLGTAGFVENVIPNQSATGTIQATGTSLISGTTQELTTITAGVNDAFTLPAGITGKTHRIFNRSNAPAKIFPASGHFIDNLGMDTAFTLYPQSSILFTKISATQWYSSLSDWVNLNTAQTISGQKTFASTIVTFSGLEPSTSGVSGLPGEFRWSSNYLYVSVGTDSWKRVPLSAF